MLDRNIALPLAARWAAALVAVDPSGLKGCLVYASGSEARQAWLTLLRRLFPPNAPFRTLPVNADRERVFGGLDLAATLATGTPVHQPGLLQTAAEGIVHIPASARLDVAVASELVARVDAADGHGAILSAGAEPDDAAPQTSLLANGLGLHVYLDGDATAEPDALMSGDLRIPPTDWTSIAAARAILKATNANDEIIASLAAAAWQLGISSLRPPLFAVRAARAAAALAGRFSVNEDDARLAAALVLAPRAAIMPAHEEAGQQEQPPARAPGGEAPSQDRETRAGDLTEQLVRIARAAIPEGLLNRKGQAGHGLRKNAALGKSGAMRVNFERGRRSGQVRGRLGSAAKVDLLATLRAAVPWQPMRRREGDRRDPQRANDRGLLIVRADDLRLRRYKAGTQAVTIFAVDASGSTALARLSEAKGAVERLLAECYVRRDQAALIAFRGSAAQTLLPPTRSLTRAKRSLAALPGGGGTPLAAGIDAALAAAMAARRKGTMPLAVFLTDGKANVGRDGKGGRASAMADALASARAFKTQRVDGILIDTAPRPTDAAATIAGALGVRYVPLPNADAAAISKAVEALR
jgi:magnesium chelatase subunit D